VFLFVIQHLLETEEVLTGLLVEFLVDISVDLDELGHDHMLEGVHSSICDFDLLV
jgi:hypothetical protein